MIWLLAAAQWAKLSVRPETNPFARGEAKTSPAVTACEAGSRRSPSPGKAPEKRLQAGAPRSRQGARGRSPFCPFRQGSPGGRRRGLRASPGLSPESAPPVRDFRGGGLRAGFPAPEIGAEGLLPRPLHPRPGPSPSAPDALPRSSLIAASPQAAGGGGLTCPGRGCGRRAARGGDEPRRPVRSRAAGASRTYLTTSLAHSARETERKRSLACQKDHWCCSGSQRPSLVYGVVTVAASHLCLPPFWVDYFCALPEWSSGRGWWLRGCAQHRAEQ